MVSKLYKADKFYEMQKSGKIANTLDKNKRLIKSGNEGYYLMKKKTNGDMYKQKVSSNDLVYSRDEGVTKYSETLDRKRTASFKAETSKKHSNSKHFNDRASVEGSWYDKKYYKV